MTRNTNSTTSSINTHSIIEHYIIIWLDSDINHLNENTKNSLNNIQHMIHSIKTLTNIDECNHFLLTIKTEKIFMIIADSFDEEHIRLIDLIEQTSQIDSVFILRHDLTKQWDYECQKIKGIFTQTEDICNALEQTIYPDEIDSPPMSIISPVSISHDELEQTVHPCEINLPPMSIISIVSMSHDELDQSYMYSKLLTEIIYKIEYDDKAKRDLFTFCREQYIHNNEKLKAVDEFERDYQDHTPIWWYTKELFIHSLVNNALITQDIDAMIKMGFFIKDLHREIYQGYAETPQTTKRIVYRGHGMPNTDFNKLMRQKGGLFAFYNFLSTSTNEEIALGFANFAKTDSETTGILFKIEVESSICSVPFTSLAKTSYYFDYELEVLFSTNAVFRIGEMSQREDRLWQVNLTLTRETDQQLNMLTFHLRNEIQGVTAWHSMARLLYKMGNYDKAIEIFNRIIESTSDTNNQEKFMTTLASINNNIGLMQDSMENSSAALSWYEKTLEIQQKYLPADHPSFATVYDNIAMAYRSMGDYTKALLHCEKTLEIRLKSSSPNPTSLTTAYRNIGMVYESKGDYSTALSYYEKAYEIQMTTLPLGHPSFILSYNNFGGIYSLIGKYSTALSYYEKTFDLQENSLPSNHPSLATTHNNLGHIYQLMGNYAISLEYYEEALKIQQKIFPSNQLSLATTFNNMGLVHRLMGNDAIARSYYEKALKIEEKSFSSDHPSLALTYNNMGAVYQSMGEHSVALSNYRKTLKIWEKSLPGNHLSLAAIHNNIGSVYDSIGDYEQALLSYDKTIEIQQKSLSSNQLDLASTYNNKGEVYRSMGDYPKALSYYEKTLEIELKHLSTNHPTIAITLGNMAVAFDANNQYEEAFEHAEQALDIVCRAFGPNHSQTKENQKYLDKLRQQLSSKK